MTREQARRLMEAILGEQVVTAESEAADRLAERCKYNPLALEVAARRIRQIKVENPIAYYFQKAEKRFDELKMPGDKRWDMTAIFDLSYQDLSPDDQKRFRTLAIFHSTGFAPEAAARVWGDQPDEAQEAIYRFVNLSLVKGVEAKTERYRLHDLLDEYAVAKLTDQGESDSACKALAEWLIELFDRYYVADPSIAPHVTYELENLKIAAQWAISRRDGHTLALLATKPRNWLFNVFREWIVWQDWLEKSLRIGIESKEEEGKRLKANVLKAIGDVQQFRKEMKAALESYNQALELYRQVGAKLGEANVYQSLGKLQIAMNREQEGLEVLQKALDIYNEVGSLSGQANILFFMGVLLANQGELQRGIELVEKAVRLGEQIDPGHPATISMGEVLEKLRRAI
jgi:tetratricopeptide (TPR) repeat protein